MKRSLSVCIVGAGSSYTPELVQGLVGQGPDQLPLRELRLTDIDPDRLAIMAGFTQRVVRHIGRKGTGAQGSTTAGRES